MAPPNRRRPKMTFDEFVAKLPFVPLAKISADFGVIEDILFSYDSLRWRDAIKCATFRGEADVSLLFEEDIDTISVTAAVEDGPADEEHITFTFQTSWARGEGVHVERDGTTVKFFAMRRDDLEQSALRIMALIGDLFEVSFERIDVVLGPRNPEFPFRFLASLPVATAKYLTVRDSDGLPAPFEHFRQFMEKIRITEVIDVTIEMSDLRKGKDMQLNVSKNIEISRANFLTREHMERAEFAFASFGDNDLTSEDLNVLLRRWSSGGVNGNFWMVSFTLHPHQNIVLEEVLKELEWQKWDQNQRDRTYLYVLKEAVDLKDGIDIFNTRGNIGTVLLTETELLFVVWKENRFAVRRELLRCTELILATEELKHHLERMRERIERDLDAVGAEWALRAWQREMHELQETIDANRERADMLEREWM